jgi:GntR family transcriptional regulator
MARYEQVAWDIRSRITSGELPEGTRLPAETTMAAHYGISPPTVRQAVMSLRNSGLVETQHGRGTFVRRRLPSIRYGPDAPSDRTTGDGTLRVTAEAQEVDADEELADLMKAPKGTALVCHVRISTREDAPHALARVYVPRDLDPDAIHGRPAGRPSAWGDDVRDQLAAAGAEILHTNHRVTTRPLTAEETGLLQLPDGSWALTVDRTSVDSSGSVIEATRIVMPGDRAEAVWTTPTATGRRSSEPPFGTRCIECDARGNDLMLVQILESGSGPSSGVYACRKTCAPAIAGRSHAPDWLRDDLRQQGLWPATD